jgi:HK97 family phage prohead protease
MRTKAFQFAEQVTDVGEGVVEAIVSVYGLVDEQGERIVYGAFRKSLEQGLPKPVYMHDWRQPLGVTEAAVELPPGDPRLPAAVADYGGLYVRARFNLDTQRGKEAYSDLKFGTLDKFSIGYLPVEAGKGADGVYEIREARLLEWSPVLYAANPATELVGLKSGAESDTEVEMAQTFVEEQAAGLGPLVLGTLVQKALEADGDEAWAILQEVRNLEREVALAREWIEKRLGVADLKKFVE